MVELDDLVGIKGTPPEPLDGFPIDAFPDRLRSIVEKMIKLNPNLPPDYLKAAFFATASSAIGGNIRAAEGKEKPIFWTVFVGYPGDGKTAGLSIAFDRPNKRITDEYKEQYKHDLREYKKIETPSGPAPFERSSFRTKSTIEALADDLENTQKGTTFISQELTAWIENFSRNGKGNDEGWYNTSWDGNPISESTRHGRKVYCPDPCLNVVGGIQYGVLESIMNKSRLSNGFFERCLFILNDGPILPRTALSEEQAELEAEYSDLIYNLYHDSDALSTLSRETDIRLTPEANEFWTKWLRQNCELRNKLKSEGEFIMMGVAAKWEKYLIRFALTIAGLKSFINYRKPPTEIDLDSMLKADKIRRFYYPNTEQVIRLIERPSHLRGLSEWAVNLYDALPTDNITRSLAVQTLKRIEPKLSDDALISRVKRLFEKGYLFTRKAKDSYRKRF